MRFYNTLSRVKEEFIPLSDCVGIYSCGPTVYNFAHIGNMRTYLFMDWLRRALKYNGYKIKHVMNITDVGHLTDDSDSGEDKMIKGAQEQKKTPWEIAQYYTGVFMSDLKALGIEVPEMVPKATEHIPEMIEFVQGLCEKGYAYETQDGIYFDIESFAGYGKLSRLDLTEQMAGARVEINKEKRHPADFALWKKAPKEHIMKWPSPWGLGYPGWHIECSAMSLKYLGERFDIHSGGVDHIPIHHENEIAQTEGLLGHSAVRYWLHGEFMMVDGGKMSKSLNNTYTIGDLREKGFSPVHFRYFCANSHYRNKLNFTWEAMQSAKTSYERMINLLQRHKSGSNHSNGTSKFISEFNEAVSEDLNIPKALGILWSYIRGNADSPEVYEAVIKCDEALGLQLQANCTAEVSLDGCINELIERRQQARAEKRWSEADDIREQLKQMGILLEDTKEGVKWKKI